MRHPSPLLRIMTVGVAVTALVCGLSATQSFAAAHSAASVSPGAPAAPGATPAGVDSGQNAGGQSSSHAYRHGAFPTRSAQHGAFPALSAQRAAPAVPAAPTPNMYFHGATNGVGVTTGAPKVYLIFWGNQWGNAGVDANGYTTFSNDVSGEAHISQALMRGLGTRNESWSGVMTQYCQGIPAGTADCSASHEHIGYPTGGALAGVWYDNAAATPVSATANQLATEAIRAAGHFGNTTAASNRNNQYVILSPTGTTPDRFNAGADFCAWHDYTGDPTLTGGAVNSPYGDMAFTNMPYISDAGPSCGAGWVHQPGIADGVSLAEGHEYAETITDQFPYSPRADDPDITTGGWTAGGGQRENGDLCVGVNADIGFSTGTFPMQATWSNDANNGGGCAIAHPTVHNPGNTVGPITSGLSRSTAGCVDDLGNSSDRDTAIVDIYDCNGSAAQRWTIGPNGTLQINGLCMDAKGGQPIAGTDVGLWTCNGGANQQWTPQSDGTLKNGMQSPTYSTGLCLDDPASDSTNGKQLKIWNCNGGANQQWRLP